jgi:hypothetical protein
MFTIKEEQTNPDTKVKLIFGFKHDYYRKDDYVLYVDKILNRNNYSEWIYECLTNNDFEQEMVEGLNFKTITGEFCEFDNDMYLYKGEFIVNVEDTSYDSCDGREYDDETTLKCIRYELIPKTDSQILETYFGDIINNPITIKELENQIEEWKIYIIETKLFINDGVKDKDNRLNLFNHELKVFKKKLKELKYKKQLES